jgi:hypothetical protein
MQRLASSNWPSSAWAAAKYDNHDGGKNVAPVDRNAMIAEVIIWTASLPVRAKSQPCKNIPSSFLPEQGVFFLSLTLRLHLSAHLPPRSFREGYECALAPQCVHQSGGVANLTSVLKRIFGVCERGLWTAKHPESQRPIS